MSHSLARIAAVWAVLGGVALIAIIVVTMTNVGAFALDRVARPFGGSVRGLPGYEDFVALAVSAAALSFLPWCQSRRGHVSVDLFVTLLPRGVRAGIDRLWLAATAAICVFLAWMMARGMVESRGDGTLSPVLGWPEWPFYAPGVVSLLLWAAVAAAQCVAAPDTETGTEPTHG